MGRLLVTNDSVWRNQLDGIFQNSGFGINHKFQEINAYKKLNFYVKNYQQIGEDYIAACGTYIYKAKGGAEALQAIYEDVKMYGIERVRRNIIGSFAICLKQSGVIKIFVDELNTYCFYYYTDENRYLCTNSAYHIAKVINASVDEDNFLIYALSRVLSGNRTIYRNVMRLSAEKVFVIDHGKVKIENLQIKRKKYKFENQEEALKVLKEKIDEVLTARKAVFKDELLFLTGGVDSRLEFAMHLFNEEKIRTAYWRGKDLITNGREEDENLCKKMSEDNNVKFALFDVSEDIDKTISSIDGSWTDKYGDYASVYAGNSKLFAIFEKMDQNIDLINFGTVGEALRDMSDFDAYYKNGYSVEKLAEDMFMRFRLQNGIFAKEKERAVRLIAEEIRQDFEYGNKSKLSVDEAVYIFTYRRLYTDTGMINFSNLFSSSFQLFCVPEVFDVITSIPYEWKKGSSIALALTEVYKRELLEYPYFSHHHAEKYSFKTKKLISPLSLFEKLYFRLAKLKIFEKVIVKAVRPIIYSRTYTEGNNQIYRYCKQVLENSSFVNKSSIDFVLEYGERGDDISAYAQFVALVKVIDTLGV